MLKTNDLYQKRLDKEARRATEDNRNRVVSAAGNTGPLDQDLLTGMRKTVNSGQTRLALEYVKELLEVQAAQIEELQAALEAKEGQLNVSGASGITTITAEVKEPKKAAIKRPEVKEESDTE